MNSAYGCIEDNIVQMTPLQSVHVTLKANNGDLYLDARKWFKFENLDHEISSRKGLMLSLSDWNRVLPVIQAVIAKSVK